MQETSLKNRAGGETILSCYRFGLTAIGASELTQLVICETAKG